MPYKPSQKTSKKTVSAGRKCKKTASPLEDLALAPKQAHMAAPAEAGSAAVASQTIAEPQKLAGNAEVSAHCNSIDVIINDTADSDAGNPQDDPEPDQSDAKNSDEELGT